MSQHVLPHTVRIKRKRQDEPVETLHVHHKPQEDPKKRRFTLDQPASSHPAVFRRVLQQDPAVAGASALDASTSSLAAAGPTTALAATSSGPVSAAAAAANDSSAAPSRTDTPPSVHSSSDRKILAPAAATRRFHLSTKSAPSRSSSPGGGSIQKRKNVATLVESKPKKTRTAGGLEAAEYAAQKAAAGRNGSGHDVEMQVDDGQPAVRVQQSTTLKRPGRTARSASPAIGRSTNGATTTSTATAAAAGNSDDGKSGKSAVDLGLLSEMQKFAQEVEHAEEQKEKPAPSTPSKPTPIYPPTLATPPSHQKLKFQPKATPRFRDRHPERFANNNGAMTAVGGEGMDIDNHHHAESDSDDDGDYVYDTYVRYDGPPDTVIDNASAATSLPPDIGVLVINVEEQPLWEAYLEQNPAADDDDKEFDTDDEDENAEDFYANEYPEDEVASDDERDEGAYRYRVAASDEEEWGIYSDEEDLARPWGRRPAWLKGGSGDERSDSD